VICFIVVSCVVAFPWVRCPPGGGQKHDARDEEMGGATRFRCGMSGDRHKDRAHVTFGPAAVAPAEFPWSRKRGGGMTTTGPVRVQVTLRGDAGYEAGDEARAVVEHAIAAAHCPVRRADVVLHVKDGPASRRSAEVEAVLDVGDCVVHAACSAPTVSEAIGVVEHQLSSRLVRHSSRVQTARRVPRHRVPR
jgi:ribosome-associated translation inhibitor RaiA